MGLGVGGVLDESGPALTAARGCIPIPDAASIPICNRLRRFGRIEVTGNAARTAWVRHARPNAGRTGLDEKCTAAGGDATVFTKA